MSETAYSAAASVLATSMRREVGEWAANPPNHDRTISHSDEHVHKCRNLLCVGSLDCSHGVGDLTASRFGVVLRQRVPAGRETGGRNEMDGWTVLAHRMARAVPGRDRVWGFGMAGIFTM